MQGYENVSVFSPTAGVKQGANSDPEGGGVGLRTPLKNHKLYEFL